LNTLRAWTSSHEALAAVVLAPDAGWVGGLRIALLGPSDVVHPLFAEDLFRAQARDAVTDCVFSELLVRRTAGLGCRNDQVMAEGGVAELGADDVVGLGGIPGELRDLAELDVRARRDGGTEVSELNALLGLVEA
jgi:hypothetical protein